MEQRLLMRTKSSQPVHSKTRMMAFSAWMYPLSQSTAAGKPGTPRLEALDAPRWIASIQIVAYHFYQDRYDHRLGWGSNWTQFFFILSGFILSYGEMTQPLDKVKEMPVLEYVRKRLVVVYPSYFLSLVLRLCLNPIITWAEWVYLPFNLLLLQAWLPICLKAKIDDEIVTKCMPYSINGEAWFMSVLLFFWLLLRPLASRFRTFSKTKCWWIILLCWIWSCIPLGLAGYMWLVLESDRAEVLNSLIRATPIGYFHVFVVGIAGARIFILTAMVDSSTKGPVVEGQTQQLELDKSRAPAFLKYGCCIGYFIYVIIAIFVPIDAVYFFVHQGGLIPLMLLVILGAAVGVDPLTEWVFKSSLFLALGRISYVQYLNQRFVWDFMQKRFLDSWGEVAIDISYPFVLLLTAYFMQRWFETSYTEWQRARTDKNVQGFVERTLARIDIRHNRLICICSTAVIVLGAVLTVFWANARYRTLPSFDDIVGRPHNTTA